jgi:hypothetical protein
VVGMLQRAGRGAEPRFHTTTNLLHRTLREGRDRVMSGAMHPINRSRPGGDSTATGGCRIAPTRPLPSGRFAPGRWGNLRKTAMIGCSQTGYGQASGRMFARIQNPTRDSSESLSPWISRQSRYPLRACAYGGPDDVSLRSAVEKLVLTRIHTFRAHRPQKWST